MTTKTRANVNHLHGSVALAGGDLDAPAAGPRAGAEGAPYAPRPVNGRRVVLLHDAQAVLTLLRGGHKENTTTMVDTTLRGWRHRKDERNGVLAMSQ